MKACVEGWKGGENDKRKPWMYKEDGGVLFILMNAAQWCMMKRNTKIGLIHMNGEGK